jgi:SAM-dependent methyltransferase
MPSRETDWLALWRELVLNQRNSAENISAMFTQKERARGYETRSREKSKEKPDVLLDFVRQSLQPSDTVLDVGAGTGRWTILLAQKVKRVTAVEPAAAMLEILREKAAEAQLNNIEMINAAWQDAVVPPHDVAICAHAMYASADFAAFVHKMEQCANRACYLALRLFRGDGIMAELSRAIYGHPHDSPNFIVAYNALFQMNIYASVVVENYTYYWTSPDMENAVARAKRHLRLDATGEYDGLIRETLRRRLIDKEGIYTWPDGMRSALAWWQPRAKTILD